MLSIAVGIIILSIVLVLVVRSKLSGPAEEPGVFKGHDGYVTTLSVSTDSRELLSGDSRGKIRYWNIIREELIGELPGHAGGVQASPSIRAASHWRDRAAATA